MNKKQNNPQQTNKASLGASLNWMVMGRGSAFPASDIPEEDKQEASPAAPVPEEAEEQSPAAPQSESPSDQPAASSDAEEPRKGITLQLPLSLHRRLTAIKYDFPGEKITTLGIRAIQEFVARMEEEKKNSAQ